MTQGHSQPHAPPARSAPIESAADGEAALYRMLFAVAALLYVGWWPVNRFAMHVEVDPLWERCALGVVAVLGYLTAKRPSLRRYAPLVAEVVLYGITVHFFTLIVRNGFNTALQVGAFITLASIGLVPRTLPRTIAYALATCAVAALACWLGDVSASSWTLLFGGVVTLETVAFGIALRLNRITVARERAERALVAAKDAAERAARIKNELLAKVSHELRTPMNGVVNMVQLAKDAPLTPLQREYLETATNCATDMLRIINDLLDVSKAEAGRMALHPTHFSLAEVLERALKELALRAAAKDIALLVTVQPGVPDQLFGDGLRLQQVLVNLIGNAVKFTAAGSIEIMIRCAAEQADGSTVRLSFRVSDTGPGIPAEALERIFVAFAQADGSVTRRYGGTGLGLTISSELVELMGGRLEVTSEVGVGSTFSFQAAFLPSAAEPVTRAAATAVDAVRGDQRRLAVLLAEDNAVNQRIVRAVLEGAGHEVVVVGDGRLALDALAQRDFDVVLLDVQMPELDGREVARRIRGGAVPGKEAIPLVATTAQAVDGDRDRCAEAGMNAYLAKPIDRDVLLATITNFGTSRGPAETAPAPPEPTALDDAELRGRLGDDPALLAAVLSTYRESSRALLSAIARAVSQRAAASLQHEAHTLKGALLTLGAKDAAQAAAALERLGESGGWGGHDVAFAELERELARVDDCIARRYRGLLERDGDGSGLA